MKHSFNCIFFAILLLFTNQGQAQKKPKVWIISDMSDKTIPGNNKEGTVNDPDDISAMAGYLLMANCFDTKGIVIASTHRKELATAPNQANWANDFFGTAINATFPKLAKQIKGYPSKITFQQSCIKETGERFLITNTYNSLNNYSTIKALYNVLLKERDTINILCWGSLTEPAILVNYCINNGKQSLLQKIRFIAHWTNSPLHQGTAEHPENVANCREDAAACAYLKAQALNNNIKYYELGAIGQHGIVSGSPKGTDYYDQYKTSPLGKIYAEGKFTQNCVDDSDCATYWVLLGNWGVSLSDVANNGTNGADLEKANELKFKNSSKSIHDELLRRSKLATN